MSQKTLFTDFDYVVNLVLFYRNFFIKYIMKTGTLIAILILSLNIFNLKAQNPFIRTHFTSNPSPLIYNETAYIFACHDEDYADKFRIYEWRLYSSKDMVNWRDHGSPLSLDDFEWAGDLAGPGQCIMHNGKFYFFASIHSKLNDSLSIGVAVADKIDGPYTDAIGKPLVTGSDPTVFVDDDGSVYLFWGKEIVSFARLNDDMISFNGKINQILPDCYTESPFLTKRNGKYHLLYAAGGYPEHIAYSTAYNIEGPYVYEGEIMSAENFRIFTNRCGVFNFKNHYYFVYHNCKLSRGNNFDRSIAIEEFSYTSDGFFPAIKQTDKGVEAIDVFYPYALKIEAECMSFSNGISTERSKKDGVYVSEIHKYDYIKISNLDFGKVSPQNISVRVASGLRGGEITFHADSLSAAPFAKFIVKNTGGWEKFKTLNSSVWGSLTGIHDIYIKFDGNRGNKICNFDFWKIF